MPLRGQNQAEVVQYTKSSMVEEILSDLYRIEIPLPKSPLKALNSYIIRGRGRFLVVDTGWNLDECQREMSSSLKRLGVDLEKTDFFITHCHADHVGLVASLATDTSRVYLSKKEISTPDSESRWQEVYRAYLAHGFEDGSRPSAIPSWHGRYNPIGKRLLVLPSIGGRCCPSAKGVMG